MGTGGGSQVKQASNMNLRGAIIHVLGDLVQSIGVAVAGALIWWRQVLRSFPLTPCLPPVSIDESYNG